MFEQMEILLGLRRFLFDLVYFCETPKERLVASMCTWLSTRELSNARGDEREKIDFMI